MVSRLKYLVCVGFLLGSMAALGDDFASPASWKPGPKRGTRVGLDAQGRVVALDLGNGRVVRTAYDPKGRPIRQESSRGDVIRYKRDADGRLQSATQKGVEKRLLYDGSGRVVGSLTGGSAADLRRAAEAFGIPSAPSAEIPQGSIRYAGDGKASGTTVGGVDVQYVHGYASGDLTYLLRTKQWSYDLSRRRAGNGGMRVSDSAGQSFQLEQSGTTRWLLDDAGRAIAVCRYDDRGRPSQVIVANAIVIEYSYRSGEEWEEKIVRRTDGTLLWRFGRTDYDDPELQTKPGGELRAATGDVVAKLVADELSYTVGSPVEARVGADGVVRHYTFIVPSRVGFAEDQIRVMPDGSLEVYPALPHAEMTTSSRTVYPFKVGVPARWKSEPRRASSGKLGNPRGEYIDYMMSCSYVEQSSEFYGNTVIVHAAHWECSYYFYWVPDPWYYQPPNGGGTPYDAYNQPLTADQQSKVSSGTSIANDRVCNMPDCQMLFTVYGKNGQDVIASTTYLDGAGTTECNSYTAWTRLNSTTVYVCPGFANLSDSDAAVLLIHEALHSSGMSHDEGFSNDDINNLVRTNCGL